MIYRLFYIILHGNTTINIIDKDANISQDVKKFLKNNSENKNSDNPLFNKITNSNSVYTAGVINIPTEELEYPYNIDQYIKQDDKKLNYAWVNAVARVPENIDMFLYNPVNVYGLLSTDPVSQEIYYGNNKVKGKHVLAAKQKDVIYKILKKRLPTYLTSEESYNSDCISQWKKTEKQLYVSSKEKYLNTLLQNHNYLAFGGLGILEVIVDTSKERLVMPNINDEPFVEIQSTDVTEYKKSNMQKPPPTSKKSLSPENLFYNIDYKSWPGHSIHGINKNTPVYSYKNTDHILTDLETWTNNFADFNIAETIKKRPVYYPKGPNGEGQQFFKPLFNQTNANIPKSTILETISNYVKQTELPNQKVLVLSLSCTEKAMCGRISSLISRKSGLRQTDPFTSHSYGYQQPSFTRQFIKIAKNQNNITRKKINTLAYPKKIKKGKLKQSRKHAKIHAKKHVKKYAKKTSSKTFKYKK